MPPVLRSILAVILGFLTLNFVIILLTLLSAFALRSGATTSSNLAFSLLYSLLACLAGGYVCGLVAGRKPLQHTLVLAGIMLAFGLLSYLRYHGPYSQAYRLLLIAMPPILVVAGGALFARHQRNARTRIL